MVKAHISRKTAFRNIIYGNRLFLFVICSLFFAVTVYHLWVMPVQQVTTQIKGIIVIDPGHGGFDGGAIGLTKVREDAINLAISQELQQLFIAEGYQVIMTRENENAVGKTKDSDMAKRREIIENSNADVVISVHCNKYKDPAASGPIVFYYKGSTKGEKLASFIQQELNTELQPPLERTYRPQNYFILRSGKAPCVLVECGFLSNKQEEKLLQTSDYQGTFAYAVLKGAIRYLNQRQKSNEDVQPVFTEIIKP